MVVAYEAILICASVAVAFLSRNIMQAYNESRVVGNMCYTSFIFLLGRVILYYLPDQILPPNIKNGLVSILLTIQALVIMGLYFGPKFLSIYRSELFLLCQHIFTPSKRWKFILHQHTACSFQAKMPVRKVQLQASQFQAYLFLARMIPAVPCAVLCLCQKQTQKRMAFKLSRAMSLPRNLLAK